LSNHLSLSLPTGLDEHGSHSVNFLTVLVLSTLITCSISDIKDYLCHQITGFCHGALCSSLFLDVTLYLLTVMDQAVKGSFTLGLTGCLKTAVTTNQHYVSSQEGKDLIIYNFNTVLNTQY
jgi:uncharacterized membrane protein required for colicin V production